MCGAQIDHRLDQAWAPAGLSEARQALALFLPDAAKGRHNTRASRGPLSIEERREARIVVGLRYDTAGRLLCCAAPLFGALAHVCLFYIGYHLVAAAAAVGCGLAGMVVRGIANRKDPDRPVSWIYYVIAWLGILIGIFYGASLGPFILFFPSI